MNTGNLDGSVQWNEGGPVHNCSEDSTQNQFEVKTSASLSPVHFIRLTLRQSDRVLSTNLYLRGLEEGNYRAIRELPSVKLQATTSSTRQGDTWLLTTQLTNPSATPALMVRLIATRAIAGDRILPVLYSDNYITLMPHESRTLTTELNHADTRGQPPQIQITGFNS